MQRRRELPIADQAALAGRLLPDICVTNGVPQLYASMHSEAPWSGTGTVAAATQPNDRAWTESDESVVARWLPSATSYILANDRFRSPPRARAQCGKSRTWIVGAPSRKGEGRPYRDQDTQPTCRSWPGGPAEAAVSCVRSSWIFSGPSQLYWSRVKRALDTEWSDPGAKG